jgi:hypothetical protein
VLELVDSATEGLVHHAQVPGAKEIEAGKQLGRSKVIELFGSGHHPDSGAVVEIRG